MQSHRPRHGNVMKNSSNGHRFQSGADSCVRMSFYVDRRSRAQEFCERSKPRKRCKRNDSSARTARRNQYRLNLPNRIPIKSYKSRPTIRPPKFGATHRRDLTDRSTADRDIQLRTAVETGLAQNPDLIALRQAEGVGTAALGVAQTYPFNPFVQRCQATPYPERSPSYQTLLIKDRERPTTT